jgi:hypothetical protein
MAIVSDAARAGISYDNGGMMDDDRVSWVLLRSLLMGLLDFTSTGQTKIEAIVFSTVPPNVL